MPRQPDYETAVSTTLCTGCRVDHTEVPWFLGHSELHQYFEVLASMITDARRGAWRPIAPDVLEPF